MNKIAKICAIGGLVLAVGGGTAYGISYGSKPSANDAASNEAAMEHLPQLVSMEDQISAEIILSDSGITVSGDDSYVSVSDSTVTITGNGVYSLTGTLSEGQIYVNADNSNGSEIGGVGLLLNGVDISNSSDAAIYIENSDTVISLADGTENRLQSGTAVEIGTEEEDSEASGGAVYAKDDLWITGSGSLQVFGYINNGIQSSNHITIDGENIEVTAVNNGIKGKDSVTVSDGKISVRSGGDGIKSDDTAGDGYGVIKIYGGNISIESDGDGIQAETKLEISGGEISVISGGGSENAFTSYGNGGRGGFGDPVIFGGSIENLPVMPEALPKTVDGGTVGEFNRGKEDIPSMPENDRGGRFDGTNDDNGIPPEAPENGGGKGGFGGRGRNDNGGFGNFGGFRGENSDMDDNSDVSTKGIKCGGNIRISGGSISIDSYDDAIHSNDSIYIYGGEFSLASGDDGIHADNEFEIDDGNILVTRSYEGLEANQIHLNGGSIDITASDDGINAYGGQNNFGGFGGSSKTTEETPMLYFSGADVVVNANGDGIDSNGSIFVEDGTIIVNGPVDSMNGAIDSGSENGGKCIITGGTIIAIGSSGMDESFSSESSQCSFRQRVSVPEGSEIVISDSGGNVLFRHTAVKNASSVVFSCPDMKVGEKYILSVDGQETEIEQSFVSVSSGGNSGFGGDSGRSRR